MSQVVIQNATTKANTYLPFSPAVVGDITPPVHGQSLAWDADEARYDNDVETHVDVVGELTMRSAGGGALPMTLSQFDIDGRIWNYATTDSGGQVSQFFMQYHLPHCHKPNSDTWFHLHIGTNVSITTTTVFQVFATFAKRGEIVPAPMTQLANISYTFTGAPDLRRHIVVEVPLSTAGGSATTLNNAVLETDGLVFVYVRYQRGANGDNMANTSKTFVFQADLHIKTDMGHGTKNRAAPFRV